MFSRGLLSYNDSGVRRLTMSENLLRIPSPFYRCAGPNCGVLKGGSDRWWIMWSLVWRLRIAGDASGALGRKTGFAGRRDACLRRGVRAETAVAVHGKCNREPDA